MHVSRDHAIGAIAFSVSSFRDRGFLVGYDPLKGNPYHGNVWENVEAGAKLTKGTRKALLREAAWVVEIPGVSIAPG